MKHIVKYMTVLIFSVLFIGAAILPAVSCYAPAAGQNTSSDKNVRLKDYNIKKGKKLTINLKSGGSVHITGWDKEVVSTNIDPEDKSICPSIEETEEGLLIFTDFEKRNCSIDLDIKVPDEFDLNIETMGGDVTLSGITGDIEGQTMGGSLNFSSLKGEIDFTTMGGEINLKDSQLDGKLKTMGGEVVFENVVGNVKGSSMGGNVVMKNVTSANGESTGNKVVISTMGGSIDVDEAMHGAELSTMGGDVVVKKAANYVTAKTMGGNIELIEVDGGVKATTMSGDIDVKITGDNNGSKNIHLISMAGDVKLTVPASLSMDIDARLTFTKNAEAKYNIISDFDLKKEVSEKWDTTNGDPRKVMHGTGVTGNAKYKVILETVNGNIYLKKS